MKIGIITIHKIINYGSVLQAFALQKTCEGMGVETEIIDYTFPNKFHRNNPYVLDQDKISYESKWIKLLFGWALLRQHRGIRSFIRNYQRLTPHKYNSPEALKKDAPQYDVYISGSDQLWSPRHCNGDPAFMLDFAPDSARKISYASSIGSLDIPKELEPQYCSLLSRYSQLSVREKSGVEIIKKFTRKEVRSVLDPTLLLNHNAWNKIAVPKRLVKKKYILCYLLNYSFNAFPYADNLVGHIQKETGYEVVRVARPPHHLTIRHNHYRIGASPEEFLALVRDAEIVVTTSFHGTAFALNYGRPVFSVIKDRGSHDCRQSDLLRQLGLEQQIITINDDYPSASRAFYDYTKEQEALEKLREYSISYLNNAIYGK